MIIVTATLWPGGQAMEAKELLHASISNVTSEGDQVESYSAHVTARPHLFLGVEGFDADVEVTNHIRSDGIVPLLMSVLEAGLANPNQLYPQHRTLARLTLREVHEFDAIISGRK
jgi:hypothetical protein